MTAEQISNLDTALTALAIARDDLRRIEDYARRMVHEGRGDNQIAEALRVELIAVKRMINSAQISAHGILMARDQLTLRL